MERRGGGGGGGVAAIVCDTTGNTGVLLHLSRDRGVSRSGH